MSIEQVVLQRQAELARAIGVPVPPALTPDSLPITPTQAPAPAPATVTPAPAPAPVAPATVTLTKEEYDKLLAAKAPTPARKAEIEATLDGNVLVIKVPLIKNPTPSKTGRSMTVARSGPRPWTAVLVDGRQVRLGEVSAYVTL